MRKMNRFIPVALACAIFAAQPVQAATIIRDSDKQATSQNKQTTNTTQNPQAGNEGGPGYEDSKPNTSNNTTNTAGQSQVSAEAKAAADAIAKPTISAEAGILYDVTNGRVLFEKNADEKLAPASTTKLMTALLVLEKANLDDKVTFSKTAVTNLESGAVKIGLVEGDQVSVKDSLYALLLKSANEVGNALAEHVAGSNQAFADKMNAKAAALGCTNTHFTNPHGLNDPDHYTTAHDMALIARAAFQNDVVKTVASTRTYTLPATKKNPSGLTVTMGHKMLNPSDSRYYEGIIGGKTGYTSKAGNTLVTVAERNGVRMIAVVMKSQSTHYTDTKAMLDYGFKLAEAGVLSENGAGSSGNGNGSGSTGSQTSSQGSAVSPVTGTSGGPGVTSQRGWVKTDKGWNFIKDNGAKASGEWVSDSDGTYWIDSDTYMAKGWRQVEGKWYYLRSNGAVAKNYWAAGQDGTWYYLGSDGSMLTSTTTPDGYRVGADGAWIR